MFAFRALWYENLLLLSSLDEISASENSDNDIWCKMFHLEAAYFVQNFHVHQKKKRPDLFLR